MALNYEIKTDYTILDIVILLIVALSFLTMIMAGYRSKKTHIIVNPDRFIYIGIVALIWTIISLFIPIPIGTYPYVDQELQGAFTYILFFFILIPNLIYFFALGWMIYSIGNQNEEYYGKNLIFSGYAAMAAYFLDIGYLITYHATLFFQPMTFIDMSNFLYAAHLVILLLILTAAIFFLIFSLGIKEYIFMISSILLLLARIISVFSLFL